ncbi:kinetochore Spc25 [Cryptosporidium sp. chipmunk genotype I]|uniref:kinetochore Spc25 n=1 Tax=Cryptosporidium sp. chipmunk genotype I TaxID=1280935 RepID=UPI00351A57D4|nr:kinetochore Spc25 [Cryptosporidium sp. chipmunk genotype I]
MEAHSAISNEIGEEIQDLKNKLLEWSSGINGMLELGVEKLNDQVSRDINVIKDSSIRIDGLEKRIKDSQELSEIKKVVELEQEEFKKCFNTNANALLEKVGRLEKQLQQDRQRLEQEKLVYEADLRVAKQQSLEREKSCRIYSENLGLNIGKVNGNNRFTFTCLDENSPDREFYFDLFYNEKAQLYEGIGCSPQIRDFQLNIELLNSKSITFRQFMCKMRKSFKQLVR